MRGGARSQWKKRKEKLERWMEKGKLTESWITLWADLRKCVYETRPNSNHVIYCAFYKRLSKRQLLRGGSTNQPFQQTSPSVECWWTWRNRTLQKRKLEHFPQWTRRKDMGWNSEDSKEHLGNVVGRWDIRHFRVPLLMNMKSNEKA